MALRRNPFGFNFFGGGGGGTSVAPPPGRARGSGPFGGQPGSGYYGDVDPNEPGHGDQIDFGIRQTNREAGRLADIEDANDARSLGFAQSEFDRFNNTPAITDDELNQMFGMSAEKAGSDANTAYSNLRQGLGDNGFFAGAGAGLAGQIELARLGQLTGSARDLRLYKARLDTDKAMQRLQASSGLADRMATPPSQLRLDALGATTALQVGREGARMERDAARENADATRDAGKSAGASNILSAGIGLL